MDFRSRMAVQWRRLTRIVYSTYTFIHDRGESSQDRELHVCDRTILTSHFCVEDMTSCEKEGTVLKSAGLQISFVGCGALGVYYSGVCKCLIDHDVLDEFEQLYGASAGAVAAVCFVCKCDPLIIYEWFMELFKFSREYSILGIMSPSFNLFSRLRDFLETILPQDAHRLCRNRVHISLSVLDGFGLPKNWLLTDFTTRKELINVSIDVRTLPMQLWI